MPKVFNTTGLCVPEKHYMVNIDKRLRDIKVLVDEENYFTINKARQYGKTTTLRALYRYLQDDYYVILMDFQVFGSAEFSTEQIFASSFASSLLELLEYNNLTITKELQIARENLEQNIDSEKFTLRLLFKGLRAVCAASDKPIVLMIDEVDSAANNQVFLDFLAQLRAMYLVRDIQPAFKSVILAGVYDVKNLKQKIRPDQDHKYNSPWNIAADFEIDMSFSKDGIAGMLLSEKNTLFESLIGKLHDYPKLSTMLRALLFTGRTFSYAADESVIDMATMFGFIKNQNGNVAVANRIFETRLYNYYLAEDEMQRADIYKASLQDKSQFIVGGHLNMKRVLEKFVIHFYDIYGSCSEKFLEDEGRQYLATA